MDAEKPAESDFRNSLMVIILDTNPSQRLILENPENLTKILESTIILGNMHLLQRVNNRLAVLACHHHATEFLYPLPTNPPEVRQVDAQYEQFTVVEQTIKQRLSDIICNAPKLTAPCESMLAGAMCMALCYISRLQGEAPDDSPIYARILIITGSNDCSSEYMTYMNAFFTAQKLGVVLDVCTLDKHLGVLQQGCDVTGGQYLRPTQLEGLLQYMLWVYLPDPQMRHKLVLPPPQRIDYRAACFCHRELIEIGFVCSVCLSIFCKITPICTTCQTIFKQPDLHKLIMYKMSKLEMSKESPSTSSSLN